MKKTKKEQPLKIGDALPLTESQIAEVGRLFCASEGHKVTIIMLSEECQKLTEEAWKLVREWFPDTKGLNLNYTNKYGVKSITIISDKENSQTH